MGKKQELIPKPKASNRGGSIPTIEGSKAPLSFSFKHTDLKSQKFKVEGKEGQYFYKLLERLKELCRSTPQDLQSSRSPSLKCHPITWADTSEKKGFSHLLPPDLKDSEPYQFNISRNKWGRVHGIFVGSKFYVIWFDPEHELYPGGK